MLSALQGSYLRPFEIHRSEWEQQAPVLAAELCPLLDSTSLLWIFIVIVGLILVIIIAH